MGKNNFSKSLNWEDFKSLGNPDAVEPSVEDNESSPSPISYNDVVRVYLERKARGGKTVSIIKGITSGDDYLVDLCKKLKSKCGVGGSVKDGEIVIQGDQRKRLIKELHIIGYSNVKNAGA